MATDAADGRSPETANRATNPVPDRIADFPGHRKAVTEAEGILALAKLGKAFRPILPKASREALDRIDTDEMEAAVKRMGEIMTFADRFNDHFSAVGWIAFDDLNLPSAEKAVALADQGLHAEGEAVLREYWTADKIEFQIMRLKRVNAFIPRWKLAQDALSLYNDGRFNACALLVFAVMDGIVQETSARFMQINQNISASGTNFEAWDSIAGHSSGLNKVRDVIFQTRRRTNTEPIEVPYRHGIVHGMDVNFDNQMVAAKAWALLFAVGEWTRRAQDEKLEPPPPTPDVSPGAQIKETLATHRHSEFLKAAMESFKPRTVWKDGSIPPNGPATSYADGSPEKALVQFFEWWQKRNFGFMAKAITAIGQATRPEEMRAWFDKQELVAWTLLDVRDENIGRATVTVQVRVKGPKGEADRECQVVFTRRLDEASTAEQVAAAPWTFFDFVQFMR